MDKAGDLGHVAYQNVNGGYRRVKAEKGKQDEHHISKKRD